MTVDVVQAPSTVRANVNYFLEIADGGTDVIYPGTAADKLRRVNGVPMQITDLRECNEHFSLDKHGFQFVPHKSVEAAFEDNEKIKSVVYPETIELLKRV